MNIYFSCSITGGRREEAVYQLITNALQSDGHTVPTAHLSESSVLSLEKIVDPLEIYKRDINWIDECQALIAEVSTPSHGVGYEIAYALLIGKPVLCLHHQDCRVSKMITGNNHPQIRVDSYADPDEIMPLIRKFLAAV
jgi:nucleoside 2-deoxyribosyltransferase